MTAGHTATLVKEVEILRVVAMGRLEQAMRRFGNVISKTHERGLQELVTGLVEQALGVTPGRFGYAPPCGAGKTQAAVAVIAAAVHLGYKISFAVSANTIKALVLFKNDLLEAGVSEDLIGLRHGKSGAELEVELAGEAVPPEAKRDTGNEDRQIMLVSHSRLRGKDGALFSQQNGKLRGLLIWDESLFVSSSGFVSGSSLRTALAAIEAKGYGDDASELTEFLRSAMQTVEKEADSQRRGSQPREIDLSAGLGVEAASNQVNALRPGRDEVVEKALGVAKELLDLASRPVAVALSGSGNDVEALIHYRVVVDPAYSNIAVLDASFALRELGRLSGIVDRTTPAMRASKRFDSVKVYQYLLPAGKSTQSAGDKRAATKAAEIAVGLPSGEACLFVVAKAVERQLARVLRDAGIDLSERGQGGELRFPVLTWGRETSSNSYRHCKHVVLVGVQRRNLHDLAASTAGEADYLTRPTSRAELRRTLLSEMAHCVLQASNRGAMRVVKDGQAESMKLYVIDAEKLLAGLLLPSMPGAGWDVIGQPLRPAGTSLVDDVAKNVVSELGKLAAGVDEVSCRELKRRATKAISPRRLTKEVWVKARRAAEAETLGMALIGTGRQWRVSGQSFIGAPAPDKPFAAIQTGG